MTFKNNELYKPVFHSEVHNMSFYMPQSIANGYHNSRYVAAGAQEIFSNAGATKERAAAIYKQIQKICMDSMTGRTYQGYMDINTLIENLLYRHAYPVDEDCAIRMGAIFTFIEGEDPNTVDDFYTRKKVDLAKGNADNKLNPDPKLYDFFLFMGVEFTPSYRELSHLLTEKDYLINRKNNLESLRPKPSPTL